MGISINDIHIYMHEIFKNPYIIVFLFHISVLEELKLPFLVFTHSCNPHTNGK